MRLGAIARTRSPLTYADPAAPVLERAFINLVEVLGGRSTLVSLYEHWRAQWPLSGMSLWSSALCWTASQSVPWPRSCPFKILAHSQLMRVPELIPYFLPIDFNETEEAVHNNIEARAVRSRRCEPARRS
ncbi:MAG TPA: hypothetical protein VJ822_15405 [Dongiaceae bacterium]|nr:hypothetical protein [Dongiaceae bacterium]